ncbi:MAG TPA: hypothetical protein VF444_17040 [Pseudonocardiaceae bacterium]
MKVDLEARKHLLESAGLRVVDLVWGEPVPEPMAAWRLLIMCSVVPTATVPIAPRAAHLPAVEAKWEKLAQDAGIRDSEDGFLISVEGACADDVRWARVKPNQPLDLASKLGLDYGNPEFVATDTAGRNVCGVTSEEYDIWIVKDILKP